MAKNKMAPSWSFGLLLLITAAGILVHVITGLDYPAPKDLHYEFNVLFDLYEGLLLVPLGLLSLVAYVREAKWGAVLMAAVAATTAYNYAMLVTGQQNMWVFLWTTKLALSGTCVAMLWSELPELPTGSSRRGRYLTAVYLILFGLLFAAQMGQRLLASATGRLVDMTMVEAGPIDWGNPVLRDAIVYFSMVVPFNVAAVAGLFSGARWGGRAAALVCGFLPVMASAVLFTGPLKEFLLQRTVSGPMWGMSITIVLAVIPAFIALSWLMSESRTKGKSRQKALTR